MKASIATSTNNTAIINDDDDLDLLPTEPLLTKAQAARYLDKKFVEYVTANGVPELINLAPDFRTLIDENVRDDAPPSSIDADGNFHRRGNKAKWGAIPFSRSPRGGNDRLFFRRFDLDEWFNDQSFAIISRAAHKGGFVIASKTKH